MSLVSCFRLLGLDIDSGTPNEIVSAGLWASWYRTYIPAIDDNTTQLECDLIHAIGFAVTKATRVDSPEWGNLHQPLWSQFVWIRGPIKRGKLYLCLPCYQRVLVCRRF